MMKQIVLWALVVGLGLLWMSRRKGRQKKAGN